MGVGNYSHVSRKFTGEKYRSNVTVPSETEHSLFFFFYLEASRISKARDRNGKLRKFTKLCGGGLARKMLEPLTC